MEQENKYYRPGADELFIGYECEACFTSYGGYVVMDFSDVNNPVFDHHKPEDKEAAKNWSNFRIIEKEDVFTSGGRNMETTIMCLQDNRLRTTYLTKEQIEAEGWVNDGYDSDGCTKFDKQVGNEYYLIYYADWDEDHKILITWWTDKGKTSKGIMFQGECKSINEFRKLCKWLGINGTAK